MVDYLEMKEKDNLIPAIANLLSFTNNLANNQNSQNVQEIIDFTFQISSLETNCENLCDLSFSFSNECLESMKNSSGHNLALLSSSSGVTLLNYQNLFSIAIYSPIIDKNGNSLRGLEMAKEIIQKYLN